MGKMNTCCLMLLAFLTYGCYGINSETSEISTINTTCLDSLTWDRICETHSVDRIEDSSWIEGLEAVKNHFIKPDYILYFDSEPREIIGCSYYSIRVAYNPQIAHQPVSGLSTLLSNEEQTRIRNRVFKELMKYQCEKGQEETLKAMEQ